jgi:hypothetical protein
MFRRILLAALLVASAAVAILAAGTTCGCGPFAAPVLAAETAAQSSATSIDDQVELAVTVYNSQIALVRDVRQIELPRGEFDLEFQDIAATVNPATVHFRSLTEPGRVSVLEQNYEYDLLEPDKLLRKYVGRDVTLVRVRQEGGQTREEAVTARLLSYNEAPVWRINGEIVTGLHADHIRFPELPGNLHVRPTLIWSLDNSGGAAHRVEASYLAGSLSWSADYVLTVGRDEKTADLDGWVTVTNGSGTAFRNASLQLVAGDLNRVRERFERRDMMVDAARAEPAAPPMSQEAFGDYHLYRVARKTTINHNETKQISMLNGTGFAVAKRYVVNGHGAYYRNARQPGAAIRDAVQVFYRFENRQDAGLGMPMPAGIVRVYQADARGGTQFVGEDRVGHTPKDETLNLQIGTAFDIVAERKQIDFERIADRIYEVEYEVVLRNHKAMAVSVEVNEQIGGSWQILRSTHAATKTAAFAAQFQVPVPAEGETTVRYRVRVTY